MDGWLCLYISSSFFSALSPFFYRLPTLTTYLSLLNFVSTNQNTSPTRIHTHTHTHTDTRMKFIRYKEKNIYIIYIIAV